MNKTTGTPALTNLDTADVLELSSEEDLKYLAAIGLRALVAYEAVGDDDELDGGDYQQAIAQVINETAQTHAARPEFLPTDEETAQTDGEIWKERFFSWLWNI